MDFLVFAPNPWDDLWRNRQQIFSRLAARHRVLYVEPGRASLVDWRRRRIPWARVQQPALTLERPNLWLYRIPALLPTRGDGGRFDRAADAALAAHLRRTLRRLGFLLSPAEGPVLWLYRPSRWCAWAAALPHRSLVYHITDDYAAFGHLSEAGRAALLAEEQGLLAAADLVIVTAPRLLELKAPYARRIELIPNGVDAAAFQAPTAVPQAVFALGLPPDAVRLGYSGHVSNRLDLPLLRSLALARPQWQWLFAGSEWDAGCRDELAALKALPNVHFLGLLPVQEVPGFIAACDVCLIPYRINDETRAISSLKLYEYLAAGKPVVSARVPAAEEQARVVHIAAGDVVSWLDEIEHALAERHDPALRAARHAVAAANTWDARVQQIERVVGERSKEPER